MVRFRVRFMVRFMVLVGGSFCLVVYSTGKNTVGTFPGLGCHLVLTITDSLPPEN